MKEDQMTEILFAGENGFLMLFSFTVKIHIMWSKCVLVYFVVYEVINKWQI